MNRRCFIKKTGIFLSISSSIPPHLSFPFKGFSSTSWNTFITILTYENDQAIERLIQSQNQEPDHPFRGGFPNSYDIYQPMGAAMFLQYTASALISTESQYYQSEELITRMNHAMQFLLNVQHEDGTIDLLSTNFHSTPDTGFVVEPLCLAYTLLDNQNLEETNELRGKLKTFLLNAGDILSIGGIHTPNHRWVVSMALSRIHHLFPDSKYLNRIDTWLSEGIDIDPDGQYTEKSTNIYSPLTDRCLITIARLTQREELLDPVRRNLEMTLYYMHPNGEIATEASGRQDQYTVGTLQEYFYPYHFVALKDQNPIFASMSRHITQTLPANQLIRNLAYIQEDPSLNTPLPDLSPLPTDYEKSFPYSQLVRIRREQVDATLLANNPLFFTFSKGNAVLQGIRFATAFFGKGQFVGDSIEKRGSVYMMTQSMQGPYYQPYPADEIPGDGDWEKMPRPNRPMSEIQQIQYKVEIWEKDKGFSINISITGTAHVPVAIEMGFRKGGILSGVTTLSHTEGAYLLSEKQGSYEYEGDTISFGPGQAAHTWTQLRGALPKLDAECVFITGYTPFTYELTIS